MDVMIADLHTISLPNRGSKPRWRTVAALVAPVFVLAGSGSAQQPASPSLAPSVNYTIFIGPQPVGTEQVSVNRTADGWTITSSGRAGRPLDLVSRQVEVRYTSDWKPLTLRIDAILQGQPITDRTAVQGTTATTAYTRGTQSGQIADAI